MEEPKRGRKNRGEDGESRVWVSRDMGKKRRGKKGSVRLVVVNSNEPKAPKQRRERQEPRDSSESRGRSHKRQKCRENHRGTPGWGAQPQTGHSDPKLDTETPKPDTLTQNWTP